jgi:hypothetical protein
MDDKEIISYAKAELERMENTYRGPAYRCAAVLKDGVKLPCVLLVSAEAVTELALRRFEETRADAALSKSNRRFGTGMEYRDVVKSFVAFGTTYLTEFFQMPDGYVGEDIVKIIPHKAETAVLRERPFFTCHVTGL